ncbi:MAG: hypothetical protein KY428_08315, partial [Bacteroidetes bacterium]|nr:hypothetical protein [Bacteroidota bacterium]
IVEEKGNLVQMLVSDTGQGISDADMLRILDIEDTFSTPGTARERGTGLGLMLCQEFLAQHGSRLEISSQEGAGSQFSFALSKTQPASLSIAPNNVLQLG